MIAAGDRCQAWITRVNERNLDTLEHRVEGERCAFPASETRTVDGKQKKLCGRCAEHVDRTVGGGRR